MFEPSEIAWSVILGVLLVIGLSQAVAPDEGSPPPELEITVGERIDLGPVPTNAAFFMVTRNGTWILNNKRSTDQGQTWEPCTTLGEAHCQLRDGTIIAVAGVDSGGALAAFNPPWDDTSSLRVHFSQDDWATVETIEAPLRIPLAQDFWPVRGLIELEDGRLLLTMYGHMDGDRIREDAGCGGMPDYFKTRVIVVESSDRGQSWRYLATVSYNPHLGGPEGQNESDLIRLPDGRLCAFMRTGMHGYVGHVDDGQVCRDEALLMAYSDDDGRTWTDPQRIYVDGKLIAGIYPRALVTDEGVLAVLRCRPDGSVIFSPDDGAIWTDEVIHYEAIDPQPDVPYHAGMQDMALIGPNTILVVDVFTPKGWPPTDDWWGSFRAEGVPITVKKK